MSDDTDEPWTCDLCREPLLPGQMRYSIVHDEVARVGRHASCHSEQQAEARRVLDEFPRKIDDALRALDDLKASLRGRR